MLTEIVKKCETRYNLFQCVNCQYVNYCPKNCEECLKYVHFPQDAPAERKYDCKRMMDFYLCKYAHRYTSELIYAFSWLENLQNKEHLNILSIGCGPSTDLFALEYLIKQGIFNCKTIDYKGIELNTEIWSNIYNDIESIISSDWAYNIIQGDICEYIHTLKCQAWRLDIIVIQYFFFRY